MIPGRSLGLTRIIHGRVGPARVASRPTTSSVSFSIMVGRHRKLACPTLQIGKLFQTTSLPSNDAENGNFSQQNVPYQNGQQQSPREQERHVNQEVEAVPGQELQQQSLDQADRDRVHEINRKRVVPERQQPT